MTADIAHAIRKHLFATYDTEWLLKGGCELALGTAQFWASRVSYNDTKQRYDIRGIMGPDEDHSNVTNNAYTNVAAALNLYLGEYVLYYCSIIKLLNNNRIGVTVSPRVYVIKLAIQRILNLQIGQK